MTGNRLATVSEWMGNGNVNEFVKARPDVNRLTLVCFLLNFLSPLDIDPRMIAVACRGHQGVNLHA